MLPALRGSARPCHRVVFRSTRGRPRGSHPPLSRTSAHALGPRGRVPEPAPRRPHGGNGRVQHGATTGPLRPCPSPRDRPCSPVTPRARARPRRTCRARVGGCRMVQHRAPLGWRIRAVMAGPSGPERAPPNVSQTSVLRAAPSPPRGFLPPRDKPPLPGTVVMLECVQHTRRSLARAPRGPITGWPRGWRPGAR